MAQNNFVDTQAQHSVEKPLKETSESKLKELGKAFKEMGGAAKSGAFGMLSDLFDRALGQSPAGDIAYAYLDAFTAKIWGSVDWQAFAGGVGDIYETASDIYDEVKGIGTGLGGNIDMMAKSNTLLQAILGLLQIMQGDMKGWDKVMTFVTEYYGDLVDKYAKQAEQYAEMGAAISKWLTDIYTLIANFFGSFFTNLANAMKGDPSGITGGNWGTASLGGGGGFNLGSMFSGFGGFSSGRSRRRRSKKKVFGIF